MAFQTTIVKQFSSCKKIFFFRQKQKRLESVPDPYSEFWLNPDPYKKNTDLKQSSEP